MTTLSTKVLAERRVRSLLEESGLPEPDAVEYGHQCVRLFWEESKVVLVVDLDEPPAAEAAPGVDA